MARHKKKLSYTIINEIEYMAVQEALWREDPETRIKSGDTRVYWCLSWYANKEGRDCWPSETTLAREVRVDVSTVFRALQRLKNSGLIEIAKITKAKRWHNSYFLPFKKKGWQAYLNSCAITKMEDEHENAERE